MTEADLETSEESPPQWQGVNHLALITSDMDATVRFYHGTLGAKLVATIGTPNFRHYFFEFGPNCTVAFFEYSGSTTQGFAKAAGVPDPRAVQFDHLSLNLPDEESLNRLRRRLKAADCEVTDVVDHGFIRSVYFTDPNGIALEASWWVRNVTSQPADFDEQDVFGDRTPVPAVQELIRTGGLSSTPSTRLS
ncbi:MAG TPA: VOC family protein [Acidimicrobiales bacterium]|nr:VOC family protein [Acidimicrobiales bacterium]